MLTWLSCMVLAGSLYAESDWNINGYLKSGFAVDSELNTIDTDLSKGDFFLGTNPAVPGNQFELSGNRKFKSENGATGTLYFRAEYGNGTAGEKYLYSSSGGEGKDNFVELKEAFIELENLDFLPEGAKMWAGRRFYGRDSTTLSGEFWKQTSGVGFGYDANNYAIAFVGADQVKPSDSANKQTAFVLDARYRGIKVPGGNMELQLNYYMQPDAKTEATNNWNYKGDDVAETGIGLGLTYNIDGWYGMEGWSKAAVAYGMGLGSTAKGLNFGNWIADCNKDGTSIFATTYGLLNVSDKLQMGTEATILVGNKLYGQDSLTRMGLSVNPSYKVTDNMRMTAEVSLGMQTLDNPGKWGRSEDTEMRTALTLAPVFTINNDYYGRPQIKPYVTFAMTNDDAVVIYDGEQSGTFFGIQAEVWF